jgi:uncharacterized membrane protein YhaH (DUF805 family)
LILIYFNYFSTSVQYIFLKIYFKILLTRLLTEHIHRYIPENWKRIIANIIASVNYSIELQMVFRRWHDIFTDGYTDGQIKTPIELHMVFCWLYGILPKENTDRMKQVNLFWHTLSVCKFINKFIINELIGRPKIDIESFSDRLFLSMSLSIKYLSINLSVKTNKDSHK